MTRKLMIAMAIAMAISFCALQSMAAGPISSDKGIELRPGMTLTDPGKIATFRIVEVNNLSNTLKVGVRIDGTYELSASSPLADFRKFCTTAKLASTETPTPSLKKSSPKPSTRPIQVSVGQVWNCLKADASINIVSLNNETVGVGVRIDGTTELLTLNTTLKALITTLSNPSNGFQLVEKVAD